MFNFFHRRQAAPKSFFSTDIHCHIIPGVDDGSPSLDRSLELIERMQGLGFTRIFASPHVVEERFENTSATLDPPLAALNDALRAKAEAECREPIVIDRSAEYRIDDFSRAQISSGVARTLPGKHIIVENSFVQEPFGIDNFVYSLQLDGYTPILAHPERYSYYWDRRARFDELHAQGLLFQVNLPSLAGYYSKREQQTANYLLEKGYVDFLGTDIHHHRHIDCIEHYMSSRHYRRLAETISVRNDVL